MPYGDFTSSSSVSIHTDNPFNDDPSGTNIANRFLVQSNAATIDYDFGNPATVNGYGIHNFVPAGYAPAERAPHTWTFQASNDGTTWTTLDERHLESGWTAGEYRYYAVSNETAYAQYRLAITDNNGNAYTQFARLEFYGTGKSVVGLTNPAAGALWTNSAAHATYGANGAFDGNRSDTNGRWLATKADHMFVVYKFNEATAVNTLRVWNGDVNRGCPSSTSRSPKAWTFYGSNDGETWTALDTRSNETGWASACEARDYSLSYKMPFLLSFLDHMDPSTGAAQIDEVLDDYIAFYADRLRQGLPVDRPTCPYNETTLADRAFVRRNMLANPFEKFERKRFMYYSRDLGQISLNHALLARLDAADYDAVRAQMHTDLAAYYETL